MSVCLGYTVGIVIGSFGALLTVGMAVLILLVIIARMGTLRRQKSRYTQHTSQCG